MAQEYPIPSDTILFPSVLSIPCALISGARLSARPLSRMDFQRIYAPGYAQGG